MPPQFRDFWGRLSTEGGSCGAPIPSHIFGQSRRNWCWAGSPRQLFYWRIRPKYMTGHRGSTVSLCRKQGPPAHHHFWRPCPDYMTGNLLTLWTTLRHHLEQLWNHLEPAWTTFGHHSRTTWTLENTWAPLGTTLVQLWDNFETMVR